MKLATLKAGVRDGRDGRLVVVSRDLRLAVEVPQIAPTLMAALADWADVDAALRGVSAALDAGRCAGAFALDPATLAAPLPRASQWLDGSTYPNHGHWMQRAFNLPPIDDRLPLMYQGASDDFLGPRDAVPLPDEAHGIDLEGEIAVITDEVPMGVDAVQALSHIRLLVLVNDWSLRALQPRELGTGFGFLHCKPSTAFGPVAVTPDALGTGWRDGRLHGPLHVHVNDRLIGTPDAGGMAVDFGHLIAHAAATRRLRSGTVIGSGTVSDPREGVGSAALAEVRAIEKVHAGAPVTPFLRFGDRVRLAFHTTEGADVFGAIEQTVVRAG